MFLLWALALASVVLGYALTRGVLILLCKVSICRVQSFSSGTFWLRNGRVLLSLMILSLTGLIGGLGLFWKGATLHSALGCCLVYASLPPLFWLPKAQRPWTWGVIVRVLVLETLTLSMLSEAFHWESPPLTILKILLGLFFAERLLKYWLELRKGSINQSSSANVFLTLIPSITALYAYIPLASGLEASWENAFLTLRAIHGVVFSVLGRLFGFLL